MIEAAAAGIRVLPLMSGRKRPLFATGPKHGAASSSFDQISEWARVYPGCDWGFVNGPESDVFTIDVDVKNGAGGMATLKQIERRDGRLPRTWLQLTPSGGRHHIYRWPAGVTRLRRELGPGVELQGDGRITVLAGSRSSDPVRYPHRYGTHRPMSEIAQAPDWLVKLIVAPVAEPRRPVKVRPALAEGTVTYRGRRVLEGVVRVVAEKRSGRHGAILWAAARLGEAYIEGLVSEDVAVDALYQACVANGEVADYGEAEVRRWIADGWAYGTTAGGAA
jgi:Bifunctional DNA primase/polymerase, N-terminal